MVMKMKQNIKVPKMKMGGSGSFVLNGIHYTCYESPNGDYAGSVLVTMVTDEAIVFENNGDALHIPASIRYKNQDYVVIGIYGAAISGHIVELHLPDTLLCLTGFSFCNCTIRNLYIEKSGIENAPCKFSVLNRTFLFTNSNGKTKLVFATTLSFYVNEWRGTEIIGEYAFVNQSFKEIIIPDCVKLVERLAFANCRSLRTVIFENQIPAGVSISTFNLIYENISIKLIKHSII